MLTAETRNSLSVHLVQILQPTLSTLILPLLYCCCGSFVFTVSLYLGHTHTQIELITLISLYKSLLLVWTGLFLILFISSLLCPNPTPFPSFPTTPPQSFYQVQCVPSICVLTKCVLFCMHEFILIFIEDNIYT